MKVQYENPLQVGIDLLACLEHLYFLLCSKKDLEVKISKVRRGDLTFLDIGLLSFWKNTGSLWELDIYLTFDAIEGVFSSYILKTKLKKIIVTKI